MRKAFGGLVITLGLCAMGLAQDNNAAARAGAGGQGITGQPGGQTTQQATQGQAGQGQAGQNQFGQGQTRQAQPGQVGQPGQPGQINQLNQNQFGQNHQGQQGQHGQRSDQEIAACVCGEASNEIEIAKLGESKAQSDEVKQFAQQMVRDHSPGRDEMQRLAGQLAQQRGGDASGRDAQGGLDWVSIKKQIGEQCLASTKQELSKKPSHDFDRCFMGQQIVAHMKVIDELKVLRNYASSDLQQKLDKELQTAQHHLEMAKKIEEKLGDHSAERTSRKASDSNK